MQPTGMESSPDLPELPEKMTAAEALKANKRLAKAERPPGKGSGKRASGVVPLGQSVRRGEAALGNAWFF